MNIEILLPHHTHSSFWHLLFDHFDPNFRKMRQKNIYFKKHGVLFVINPRDKLLEIHSWTTDLISINVTEC